MRWLPVLLVLSLLACAQEDPPPPPAKKDGRAETRNIRNVNTMGINGEALANKIDASLNAQEEAERRRKEQAESQSDAVAGAADEPPQ
ncbi:MAG TPA: hypothetical protein VM369_10060 [Candidatus Binatia bacterium]|nr:hypothetical protein [Candidatus Binatia bacterium]